jgi:hypothetical protein
MPKKKEAARCRNSLQPYGLGNALFLPQKVERRREPSLTTALACEAIFQKPVRELFAGLYQEVEREVAARAKAITYRTDYRKPTRGNTRKLQTFTGIANRSKPTAHLS